MPSLIVLTSRLSALLGRRVSSLVACPPGVEAEITPRWSPLWAVSPTSGVFLAAYEAESLASRMAFRHEFSRHFPVIERMAEFSWSLSDPPAWCVAVFIISCIFLMGSLVAGLVHTMTSEAEEESDNEVENLKTRYASSNKHII